MGIGEYLLSVIAAALICSVITGFIDKKNVNTTIIRLLCGLFLALTAITPLTNLDIEDLTDITDRFQTDSDKAVTTGTEMAKQELTSIIKQQTEAYILDKAYSMGVEIDVTIRLDDQMPPVPSEVVIIGALSPYEKKILSQWITKDIGIPVEAQIWT